MPSIANYYFIGWQGRLMVSELQSAVIDPDPGIDGVGMAQGAWRPASMSGDNIIRTVTYGASIQEAISLREQFRLLSMQSVQCTDSLGEFWSDVLVRKVRTIYGYTAAPLYGAVRVETMWTMLPTSDPPDGF